MAPDAPKNAFPTIDANADMLLAQIELWTCALLLLLPFAPPERCRCSGAGACVQHPFDPHDPPARGPWFEGW